MKRWKDVRICLLLAAVCCVLLAVFPAMAEEEECFFYDYDPLYSDASLYASTPIFDYDTEAFYETLNAGITAYSNKISVASFGFTVEEFSWAYGAMRYSHPEMFQITSMFWYWSNDLGLVTSVRPEYRVAEEDLPARRALYNSGIQKIVDYAMEADTTIGRLMRANDYICVNYYYDYELKYRHADSVIESGKCVCEGYAALYTAALQKMGIPVTFVLSDAMNHIWNAVQLDGEWYHVDVTWNDPAMDRLPVPQMVEYNNFILSDQGITKEGHNGWTVPFTAANTRYDDAFWRGMHQATAMQDDVVYYSREDEDAQQISICSHDLTDGTEKEIHTFDCSYTGYPTPVWVDRNVLYYAHGASLYALPAEGGTAQCVYQLSQSDRWLLSPFQIGSDLILYDAEWIYDTMGRLLRFELDGTIDPIAPTDPQYTITLNKNIAYLQTEGTLQMQASIYPAPDASTVVAWFSNDPGVAKVDSKGLVTAVGAGKATIMVTCDLSRAICTLAVGGEGELELPTDARVIGKEAFLGIKVRCVRISEKAEVIGERAFADTVIHVACLPDTLVDIAPDAFEGSDDVILVVPPDSVAEEFAVENGHVWVNP